MKEQLLIETPGSIIEGDPLFMSLKNEYLDLVKRCFYSSPLPAREVDRWLKLDSLLSMRIQKITGSRSTPAIGKY